MKLLFKIFLSLNILLLCGNHVPNVKSHSGREHCACKVSPYFTDHDRLCGGIADLKVKPLNKGKYFRKLLATEFEDDNNETSSVKKQTGKAVLTWLSGPLYHLGHNYYVETRGSPAFPPSVLYTSNKLYRAIRVFRI
jgi:hypothetical protein